MRIYMIRFSVFLVVLLGAVNSQHLSAEYWEKKFSLQTNIGGGSFIETYRSQEKTNDLDERYGLNATRNFGTHIYYLLKNKQFDRFHRLKTDELWHHYYGATVSIYVIDQNTGKLQVHHLGPVARQFVATIKAGDWFGAKLRTPREGRYALLGTTMAPGFEYEDYENLSQDDLLALYPKYYKVIRKLAPK